VVGSRKPQTRNPTVRAAGDTNKNDPNDALSVAVAALRSTARREVTADDYPAVLKVWSMRHRNLVAGRPPDATPKRMICVSHAGPRALLMSCS
jgi:hypothetical protein